MKLQKFATVLPVFTGFYNTIFELCTYASFLENEIEAMEEGQTKKELEKELDTLDYRQDYEKTAQRIFEAFTENFEINFIKKWEYEKLNSPREYNYRNDSIYCQIEVDIEEMKKWYKSIKLTKKFDSFLKENFTSYDGFSSSFDNFVYDSFGRRSEDWKEVTEKNIHFILDFLFPSNEENIEKLYYDTQDQ